MATLSAIRAGLAARLLTIQALPIVYERWPGQVNPPCAVIEITDAEPEQTMGRGDLTRYNVNLHLLMPLAGGWENAQDRLDPLMTTSSTGGVFGAIHADRTLGGAVQATFVRSLPREYERRIIDDNLECLAATVPLEVWG